MVAADVCYESRNVEWLLELIPLLGRDVLMADPRRPDAGVLAELLVETGWTHAVTQVRFRGRLDETGPIVRLHRLSGPVSEADPAGPVAQSGVPGVR